MRQIRRPRYPADPPVAKEVLDPDAVPPTAAPPPKLPDRSLLALGFLAHLPPYRQEQILKQRHQAHLGQNTLCRGVELAAADMSI